MTFIGSKQEPNEVWLPNVFSGKKYIPKFSDFKSMAIEVPRGSNGNVVAITTVVIILPDWKNSKNMTSCCDIMSL